MNYYKKRILLINKKLSQLVAVKNAPQKMLFAAAKYSLATPGKRLRPLLLLEILDYYQKDISLGLNAAAALELVHTYSLIHDDLPCMDNDDFRRGKPSLHKAFNEWLALLTGDYFLTFAFEVIARDTLLNDSVKIALVQTLAHNSGSDGLIAGQTLDLSKNLRKSLPLLKFIHLKKTAALFIAAVQMGAIISNAPSKDLQILTNFAKNFGLAFQVLDDIEDKDENKELSAVSLLGEEKAKKFLLSLKKNMKKQLSLLSPFPQRLFSFAEMVLKSTIPA